MECASVRVRIGVVLQDVDEAGMRLALAEVEAAEVPVGAVILQGEGIEMLAVRQAAIPYAGEVLEWSNRHDWKSCVSFLDTEGSNPSLSANLQSWQFSMMTVGQ